MSTRTPADGIRSLVIIGGGPRAVGVLERLAANRDELWREAGRLIVHIVDPHPVGPGRIWRLDQSPLLKLNSLAVDVTMFTDETSTIEGPIRPGPSLIEWAQEVREGRIAVDVPDERLAAEIRTLLPASFPTRRLQSLYLSWFYDRALDGLGPDIEVREHRATARRVTDGSDGRTRVELDTGRALHADVVLFSLGHNGVEPEPEHRRLIDFARRRELYYLPPAFTADADTGAIVPGQRVLVRGMGLAAVDLIVLLTEGRGGRFERDGDRLRYLPSGREPRVVIGSRRGVPYHSKIGSTLQGEAPALRWFTREHAALLEARSRPIDFAEDVWPLIGKELLWAHYRELFTGHPERVVGSWDEFAAQFSPLDPRAALIAAETEEAVGDVPADLSYPVPPLGDDRDRVLDDAATLVSLVARTVPDELDRLFLPTLDRPLAGLRGDADAVQEAVRRHIRRDLLLRTQQEHSETMAVFLALLQSLFVFADLTASAEWSDRSRVHDVNGWWLGWFSHLASGPPAHRLEELLALSEAGIVDFLGAGITVVADEDQGCFAAQGAGSSRVVTASALVDARLPDTSVARSDNEVLRHLVASGHALEELVGDAGSTGRLLVRQLDTRLSVGSGTHSDRFYAIGPYTSSPFVGAFSRPRTNALSFRENDKVARALLLHLAELSAASRPTSVPVAV